MIDVLLSIATLTWVRRPWEAPEHMLADAGVELGVNYPLPVISLEESEEALAQAMAAIQQSLVEVNDKVRPFPLIVIAGILPCPSIIPS